MISKKEIELVQGCIENKVGFWQILLDDHLYPLRRRVAYKVILAGGGEVDTDDIFSEYSFKLINDNYRFLREFLKWDKSLGAWFHNGLMFEYKTWLNKDVKKRSRYVTIDEDFEKIALKSIDEVDVVAILDSFIETLNKKEKRFMRFYFKENLDESTIAEILEISTVGVRVRKTRIKDKFIHYLQKDLI